MIFIFISKFLKILRFNKHNLIEFFKRFEKLCDEYEILIKNNELNFLNIAKD